VVELTREVKKAAIELRRRHTVKLPDAIVAASAVVLGAELLTNDRQLLQIAGVQGKSFPSFRSVPFRGRDRELPHVAAH
jgi:predicted nucleic acid-binding protein